MQIFRVAENGSGENMCMRATNMDIWYLNQLELVEGGVKCIPFPIP